MDHLHGIVEIDGVQQHQRVRPEDSQQRDRQRAAGQDLQRQRRAGMVQLDL